MRVKLREMKATIEQGKWRAYGVGMDCHSRFIYVCVMIPDYKSRQIASFEDQFPLCCEDILRAKLWVIDCLARYGVVEPEPVYAIESTATYHYPVLLHFGGKPIVLNPHIARASLKKTDRFDARTMAYHCLTGLYEQSHLPQPHEQEYRIQVRTRTRVARYRRRLVSSLVLRFVQYGVTLPRVPYAIDSPQLRPVIEDLARGVLSLEQCDARIQEAFAGTQIPMSLWDLANDYYHLMDAHDRILCSLQHREKELLGENRWAFGDAYDTGLRVHKALMTAPGIGEMTASIALAELGSWKRFRTDDQVAAYAGFDPSRRISAGKVTSTDTRQGNRWLRRCFVQAAQILLNRRSEHFGVWAYRLAKRTKRNVAVVALARRLVRVAWHILRTGQDFCAEGYRSCDGRKSVADVLPLRIARVLEAGGIRWLDELVVKLQEGPLKLPGIGHITEKLIRDTVSGLQGSSAKDGESP
jgi:transposase